MLIGLLHFSQCGGQLFGVQPGLTEKLCKKHRATGMSGILDPKTWGQTINPDLTPRTLGIRRFGHAKFAMKEEQSKMQVK